MRALYVCGTSGEWGVGNSSGMLSSRLLLSCSAATQQLHAGRAQLTLCRPLLAGRSVWSVRQIPYGCERVSPFTAHPLQNLPIMSVPLPAGTLSSQSTPMCFPPTRQSWQASCVSSGAPWHAPQRPGSPLRPSTHPPTHPSRPPSSNQPCVLLLCCSCLCSRLDQPPAGHCGRHGGRFPAGAGAGL